VKTAHGYGSVVPVKTVVAEAVAATNVAQMIALAVVVPTRPAVARRPALIFTRSAAVTLKQFMIPIRSTVAGMEMELSVISAKSVVMANAMTLTLISAVRMVQINGYAPNTKNAVTATVATLINAKTATM